LKELPLDFIDFMCPSIIGWHIKGLTLCLKFLLLNLLQIIITH
jgi:hypothetical protein